MLDDKWLAIDADDVVLGKCLANLFFCLLVCLEVAISGHQDGSVRDEEVGVCGRQPSAFVFIIYGFCHGQGDESIWFAFQGPELLELRFHL